MEILQRDSLERGGFAGLRETRLVMGSKVFGARANSGTWDGLGQFVYLADAKFMPHGETKMHSHKEVDVLSVMVEGRVSHEGSLEHGQMLLANNVQVQRAGGEGFSHNEVNPDAAENRMIQIWLLPEVAGEPAGYRHYAPAKGEIARVYGGDSDQDDTYASNTTVDIALLSKDQLYEMDRPFVAYVTQGQVEVNGQSASDGDLIQDSSLSLTGQTEAQVIIVSQLAN